MYISHHVPEPAGGLRKEEKTVETHYVEPLLRKGLSRKDTRWPTMHYKKSCADQQIDILCKTIYDWHRRQYHELQRV